jgi:tRNA threonylcarbamoyladenosine biosynthesis protein TsaB
LGFDVHDQKIRQAFVDRIGQITGGSPARSTPECAASAARLNRVSKPGERKDGKLTMAVLDQCPLARWLLSVGRPTLDVHRVRSLRETLDAHAPLLLIDAAAMTVQVGWLEREAAPRWIAVTEEAGAGIFRALGLLGADPARANAFVFCEGPGSVLGIRTSAVAIRTWQVLRLRPAFAYRSLELLARARGRPGLTLIADARKQSWHAVTLDTAGAPGPLQRVAPEALSPPLATPEGFRQWSPLPPVRVEPLAYDVPELWRACDEAPLLRPAPEPDAFLHEEPSYVTWTPKVHQADVSGR